MSTKPSPNFRTFLKSAERGEIVIPVIRSALFDPNFKSFTIEIEKFEQREPDGWFHPSVHPLWPERMLYYYLQNPRDLIKEPFDPHSTMAVVQGEFWHKFIEHVGLEVGLFEAIEVEASDEESGASGKFDARFSPTVIEGIFEFKTMVTSKARKIPQGPPDDPDVIAGFRLMAPEYFAQAQEYMRLSGHRHWRGVVLSLEYPFPMREIALDFDSLYAYEIKQKYMNVRQAVADGRPPAACCTPRSTMARACPARRVCPVGLI